MRIRRVHAQAFGALRDETLLLADGLTVVYGRNEAGKSTWHAALLAALCGRRPVGKDDLDRYAPWSSKEWAVSAEVCLADGRRVELRHDLAARHGWATDLELGTDCAPEITAKGRGEVPDAARWLGLDRRAFAAVACVRQSDVRLATDQADGLRGYVERAATAAPGEETAAAALSLLDRFQRERVGTDKTTTKPLQIAQRSVESAEQRLRAAITQREELTARAARARTLRARAESVAAALAAAEAAQARAEARARAEAARAEAARAQEEARRLRDRVSLAQELAVDVPLPPPPVPPPPPSPLPPPSPTAPVTSPGGQGRRRAVALFGGAVLMILGAAALVGSGVLGRGAAALAGAVAVVAALALAAAGLASWRRVAVQPPSGPHSALQSSAPSVLVEEWLAARDAQTERRVRLESLLEGGTLADLIARAEVASRRAEQLAAAAGGVIDGPSNGGSLDGGRSDGGSSGGGPLDGGADAGAVDELRGELREAQRLADAAEAEVAQLVRDQTPVAEAEAEVERARSTVAELMELDDVLTRTRDFLARAQTRVYRDIAPRIAAVVGRDLAAVTGGRYTEAFVDPHSLAVRVRATGGVPRDAERLSIGTVEQVYLLLRVALAEQLVREGESCPLLLDDVTVHADAERTSRMLDVLLAVAARHQVVLFTQQEEVRRWAASTVDGSRHALRELTTLAPA